ncbi:hypothetical protein [Microbacterium sp. NPDC090003]|uniref:hypothetical protein n=1 Tax=Microbacterium sp. NPDC090003 TaxID=3364203 RepID=UPI0037F7F117
MSRSELAERIGVKQNSLGQYKRPNPTRCFGTARGWFPESWTQGTRHGQSEG